MFRKKLCSHCRTGKETYLLDRHSVVCPHIHCYDGRRCTMYRPTEDRRNILKMFFKR